MKVILSVIGGPHQGREYTFDGRDSFLVGRSKDAHFRLSYDDPYFSRRHFLIEMNPPRCRLLDLKSRNGLLVNGQKQSSAELQDGDEIKAGNTVFRVRIADQDPDAVHTLELPDPREAATVDLAPQAAEPNRNTVPGYYLQELLGQGGMGAVYRALRHLDGSQAAVKIITPAVARPGAAERFLREARILGELQHPHIVRFIEAGEAEDERLFIAMEFVDGPNAAQLAEKRGGTLDVTTAVRIVCQALVGLAHAHAAGFVHRDIKPANILIGKHSGKRIIKIADFGLARAFEASQLSGMTLHGEFGGTPAFMAPEQVTHYRDAKPAADQYSAAATLYYLLTGKYAFNFPNEITQLLIMILTDQPTPIHERRSDLPMGLSDAIHKAMARDPEDRFADVTAFRAALVPFGQ